MIKLKIGDNFLITSNNDFHHRYFITYMMGCFEGHNKTALGLDLFGHNGSTSYEINLDNGFDDYIKVIKTDKIKEIYILIYKKETDRYREDAHLILIKSFLQKLLLSVPDIKYRIIKINGKEKTKEFKAADMLYSSLLLDKKSILYHLGQLDEYKRFSTRYKEIPKEIQVINDTIKQMSKDNKICNRKITLKDLEYLDLIEEAKLDNSNLILKIKPLPIYPSEPFGKCIGKSDFMDNPYLFKAASYLYQGYNFGMVGTIISVNSNFRPEFIKTIDHSFDDMFQCHNWSTIGYLHFGQGHLCGGEFNDVMAHTAEHGLEYFFISLKQYITTANMRDIAGKKVWWYPIYDKEGKIVYCAGLDILRDSLKGDIPNDEWERVKNMSWEDFLAWKEAHGISFRRNLSYRDLSSSYNGSGDTFLEACKEKDPELYERLMKGAN